MTIESIGEDIPQKVLDLVADVLGEDAKVSSTAGDYLSLQIHFSVHGHPVVLDIAMVSIKEANGAIDYEFTKLAVPGTANLFAAPDWKNRFCDWGMEFENGRLKILLARLEGLLVLPSPESTVAVQNYEICTSLAVHDEVADAPAYVLQAPLVADAVAQDPIPKLRENSLAVRAAVLLCFCLAGAATSRQLFKRTVAPMPVSTPVPVSRPSFAAPMAVPHAVISSPELSVPTNCLTISTIATDNDRGLLPWLRTIKAANPVFFTRFHVTPQDLVTASIRPRHRAESAAHDTTNPAHALGEAHAYHFGQVQAGDRIFLQACPHAPVMLSYSRGATHLYNVQIDR